MIYFQSQVDRLLKIKDEQISAYRDQVERIQKELEIERKRANNAVDNLLASAGSWKITPNEEVKRSTFEDLLSQVSAGVASIGQEIEGEKEESAI